MRDHIIPVNVGSDGNLFGGLLRKRNVFEAAVVLIAGFLFFRLLLFAVPFFIKTILFVVLVLLPVAICLIGIGDQSVFEALSTVIAYKKRKDILPYSIQLNNRGEEHKPFAARLSGKHVERPSKSKENITKKEKKKMKKEKKQAEKTSRHKDNFYVNLKPDMRGGAGRTAAEVHKQQSETKKQRRRIAKQQKAERKLEATLLKARSKAVKKGITLPQDSAQHYMYGGKFPENNKKPE